VILKTARRVVVFVIGMTVLLVGVALLVLPGPAFLVIPAGLAILATEFAWARRFLRRVKEKVQNAIGNRESSETEPHEPKRN
jgi:tellurite resistance protein TerC